MNGKGIVPLLLTTVGFLSGLLILAMFLPQLCLAQGPTDCGDAPDPPYPTYYLAKPNNGAQHLVVPGVMLGSLIDGDPDGQPNGTATGDDLAGPALDDEDGVTFSPPYIVGSTALVTVWPSVPGFLNAWIDFNFNGSWAEPVEQIAVNLPVGPGPTPVSFNIPASAVPGFTFARFRFTTAPGISYVDYAYDGEVEDYRIMLDPVPAIGVDLSKTLVSPLDRPAVVSDTIQFQVLVTNTGETAFISNPFTDTFTDCVSFFDVVQDGEPVPGVGPASPITWDLVVQNGKPITPGQVITIDLYFRAEMTGTCTNRAEVAEFDAWDQLAMDEDRAVVEIEEEMDFGDAPDQPYPTLLASNGARHIIVPPIMLGALIDGEPDGQPDATATGDDLANLPDEDGVAFLPPYMVGAPAMVLVMPSVPGFLNAWIDFNADGDWADVAEQIAVNLLVGPGPTPVPFNVPLSAMPGLTFARFRFTSAPGPIGYDGLAPDGEVEDYEIQLELPPIGVDLSKLLVDTLGRPFVVSDTIPFQVVVTNTGQTAFTSNPFTDTFTNCLAFLGAFQDGFVLTGLGSTSPITWDLAVQNGKPITPGQVITIDLYFHAEMTGTCTNRAEVSEFDEWNQVATDEDQTVVKIAGVDFGDAPDPNYPTLLVSNGARHIIVPGWSLGPLIDGEPDGQPNATATGDDLSALDDEDGVSFASFLAPGWPILVAVTPTIAGPGPAFLDAWMDFNQDGDWADAGEQIAISMLVAPGPMVLALPPMPPNATIGTTFARFRLSSIIGLPFTGLAPDGEVEDYQVEILNPIDVDLSKTLVSPIGSPAVLSDTIQFQVLVTNTGPTDFISNPFTDTYTNCLRFSEAYQDGVLVTNSVSAGPVIWDLAAFNGAPITAGQVIDIDLYFTAAMTGTCTNVADVTEVNAAGQLVSDSGGAVVDIISGYWSYLPMVLKRYP